MILAYTNTDMLRILIWSTWLGHTYTLGDYYKILELIGPISNTYAH
jgi:hypothetical protein